MKLAHSDHLIGHKHKLLNVMVIFVVLQIFKKKT